MTQMGKSQENFFDVKNIFEEEKK